MKVMYMSGYADDAAVRQRGVPEGSSFLQKPFTPDALVRKVRELLDGRPALAGQGDEPAPGGPGGYRGMPEPGTAAARPAGNEAAAL
jgi:hypothetical protein